MYPTPLLLHRTCKRDPIQLKPKAIGTVQSEFSNLSFQRWIVPLNIRQVLAPKDAHMRCSQHYRGAYMLVMQPAVS